MAGADLYQNDLAQIHLDGYGFHWERAAPVILRWLETAGITNGVLVDLGCGGGQWMERAAGHGYHVCGIDVSCAMIRAARKRLPHARLVCGSFAEVDLPPCDVVTALGEPLNYLHKKSSIRKVFTRVYRALRPGGVFVFDAREPASEPTTPRTVARVADTWACVAEIREDFRGGVIVRHITTFRRVGRSYRRRTEVHRLKVCPQPEMLSWLREIGFRVRAFRGYGDYRLASGQAAYLARKPT